MLLGLNRTPSTGSLTTNTGKPLGRSPSTGSLASALRRFSSSSLSGYANSTSPPAVLSRALYNSALHANTDEDKVEEEFGDWKYLVIDPKGIRSHDEASYSKDTKSDARFAEGTVVEVGRRRRRGWTTFLGVGGCAEPTWLFDVSPKDKKVRLIEVEVLMGEWMYESCAFQRVPVLAFPSVAQKRTAKVGSPSLEVREVVSITKRVRPVSGKGSFLKLSDGRGWVLDFTEGHRVMQRWTSEGDCELTEPSTSSCPSASSIAFSSTSGIPSSSGIPSEADLAPPELGEWVYIVLDPRGIALRSEATYNPSKKIERRVHEGELVVVKERRAGDSITFLRLECPDGWVFDRQPGNFKTSRVRMMEAKVERGEWYYVVTAESGIALRARCSFSDNTKCGKGPLKGSLIEVIQRVRVCDTTFLQLKDGGKWIFDCKGGRKVLDGPVEVEKTAAGTVAAVCAVAGVHLLLSPTKEKWAVSKMRLLQHAQVSVKMIFEAEFVQWGFVSKTGASGMTGWIRMDDLSPPEDPSSWTMLSSRKVPDICYRPLIQHSEASHAAPASQAFHRPKSQHPDASMSWGW